MKKLALLFSSLWALSLLTLTAQPNQGRWMIGVSSSLNSAGSGPDLMSFGRSSSKFSGESDPYKQTSFNISPKAGYFLINNLAVGLDLSYISQKQESNSTNFSFSDKTSITLAGPFVKYYFPGMKVYPFLELACSIGGITEKSKSNYGTTSDSHTNKSGISGFGGGAGVAVPIGDKVTFDLALAYSSLAVKEKENNPENNKDVTKTFGVKLGFLVFLGGTK